MAKCLLLWVGLVLPAVVFGRSPSGFIVGGSDAAEGAWPWQLSLRAGLAKSHSCGASLIGSTSAVCAAHCIGGTVSSYEIMGGSNQRSCSDNTCVTTALTAATRHPEYQGIGLNGYPNDIAVLVFESSFSERPGLQFVPLTTNTAWEGSECYITGWGRLTGGGALPENLQETKIDVISVPDCQDLWSANQIRETHVCVYDTVNQSSGACNGDSGGPLVCRASETDAWELVGATSWGRSGCLTTSPSVYTRVSSYVDWIQSISPDFP